LRRYFLEDISGSRNISYPKGILIMTYPKS
jgi:hypothetical protein